MTAILRQPVMHLTARIVNGELLIEPHAQGSWPIMATNKQIVGLSASKDGFVELRLIDVGPPGG